MQNGDILEGDINAPDGSNTIQNISECHNGAVRSLHCSPCFEDIILSVDVWTFALWKVGFQVCTRMMKWIQESFCINMNFVLYYIVNSNAI